MSVVRYISDPHFGHRNMAIRRGFSDEYQMNEYMVKQWNYVVTKKDVTWILGDITMEKSSEYYWLDQLNGIKKIVLGNHDKPQHVPELLNYVNSVCAVQYVRDKKHGNIIFSHIPIHPCELEYRYTINIHGHVHENTLKDKRYINVSAEVVDYTPKLLNELLYGR